MTEPVPAAAKRAAIPILVRNAELSDAEAIARLSGELGYPTDVDVTLERLRGLPPEDAVLLAESPGSGVVGWIHLSPVVSLVTVPHALVMGLVVDEACRGQGIGKALMAAAEEWTRARGLTRVRLRSAIARDDAHEFYRRLGYSEQKTQRVFYRDVRSGTSTGRPGDPEWAIRRRGTAR